MFLIKDFFSKCDPADLVTFTEEIFDKKLFFGSGSALRAKFFLKRATALEVNEII